jgi:predicted Fe-Mo cluster-binding NifX family protein
MAYKIAIASLDGKFVNEHFGRAKEFFIVEVKEDQYQYIETRKNVPSKKYDARHDYAMSEAIELIADCKFVLVSQIGPSMEKNLKSKGIIPYVIPNFIDNALKQIISSNEEK